MSSFEGIQGWLGERLPGLLEEHGVPGASVAVMADGRVFEAASGVLNLDTGLTATPDAVFQIGSVTKVLTATLVMQLVDEQLLGLDDAVHTLIPGFALADEAAARSVTVRQLLTHSSGFEGDIFTDTGEGEDCLERYVALLAEAPQLFLPGELFSYNNAGFCLLGRIIEVVRGESFDTCLRRYLLRPLGIDRAALNAAEAIVQRAAVGHITRESRGEAGEGPGGAPLEVSPVWAMARSNAPAGSMLAMRASDLLTFARMHLDGGVSATGDVVLSVESAAAMQRPQIGLPEIGWGSSWGLGWELTETETGTIVGHDGNTIGQSAILRIIPEHGVALAVLTNGGSARPVFSEICDLVLTEGVGMAPSADPRPDPEMPSPERPERFVGSYGSSTVEFEVSQTPTGGLHLRRTPLGELAELDEPVFESDLVAWRENALLTVEPEGGVHQAIAFLGDDGSGRAVYLHSGRADRRVAE